MQFTYNAADRTFMFGPAEKAFFGEQWLRNLMTACNVAFPDKLNELMKEGIIRKTARSPYFADLRVWLRENKAAWNIDHLDVVGWDLTVVGISMTRNDRYRIINLLELRFKDPALGLLFKLRFGGAA